VGSRSRRLRPILALAAILGLAACTAGVPKTGEVVSVSPVTASTPPVDPATPRERDTPFSGQSPTEVAVGFMNAMNTGNVSMMRRWVMPEARDRVSSWSAPTTVVQVYSVFEPGPEYDRGDKRIVPIRVKLVGQLRGGHEWYPASGDDVLSLEMDNDRAEVRVANPGSVIWMRDLNFSRLYTPAEVFMPPDLSDPTPQLAPVPVFVANGPEGELDAPRFSAEQAVRLLLEGPQRRYDNLETAIPRGTVLRDLRYTDNVATVNLNRRFSEADGSGQLRVGQIVWTVNSLLPSASVRIMVEGRPVKTVGSDRFSTARLWRRRDQPLAGMWPRRSQGGEIVFVRRGEIWKIAPQPGQLPKAITLVAPSPKSAPTWSPDHRSMAFLVGSGTGQVLWVLQHNGQDFRVAGLRGRLSPPSWSPDSQRIYVVSRDEDQARLVEVTRTTLSARFLAMPPLPSGLQPSSVTVSPDGAFVLAVADRPDRKLEDAEAIPGGQLFLGQFGPDGVVSWSPRQLAPGLGRVYSPVWVDPVTVGFIAETENKDDLGKLWTVRSDGWGPNAVLNDGEVPMADIGNRLTVDPTGRAFVVSARSSNGAFLWMVDRQDRAIHFLTAPGPTALDTDPSYASR
jgi:Sporulation and spore germination/WD40-like Beta Propeller Repeat